MTTNYIDDYVIHKQIMSKKSNRCFNVMKVYNENPKHEGVLRVHELIY